MSKEARKLAAGDTATDETATFEWRDVEFSVPRFNRWSVDVLEALEDGRIYATLRAVLGPEQWAGFKALEPTPTGADVEEFSAVMARAAASVESLGES